MTTQMTSERILELGFEPFKKMDEENSYSRKFGNITYVLTLYTEKASLGIYTNSDDEEDIEIHEMITYFAFRIKSILHLKMLWRYCTGEKLREIKQPV